MNSSSLQANFTYAASVPATGNGQVRIAVVMALPCANRDAHPDASQFLPEVA